MSSRIRLLLLVALMVSTPIRSASACGLLSPFRWLFGCDHYHGYSQGGPDPCYRLIDDWLGYGYLRNQQGTLGHYPGNWYRNLHPHMRPGYQMAGPVMAMPTPMQMPMPMPMPMQLPTAPVYTPNWDPCCDPCANTWAPGPMPVTTMQPVTVDQGNWQTVWVPRPVTTMVPRTQWMMPGASWGDSGCDTCGTSFQGSVGYPMMQGGETQSDCGCSGGSVTDPSAIPMAVPPAGAFMPQNTLSYANTGYVVPGQSWNQGWPSYGSWAATNSPQPVMAWTPSTQWNNVAPWTPVTAWNTVQPQLRYAAPLPAYGAAPVAWNPQTISTPYGNHAQFYPSAGLAQTWPSPQAMSTMAPSSPWRGAVPRRGVVTTAFRATPSYPAPHYNSVTTQPWHPGTQAMAMQPATQFQSIPMQQFAWTGSNVAASYPQMTAQNPFAQPTWGANPAFGTAPRFAGDIAGDHEFAGPQQTGMIQNAYRGQAPIVRTGMTHQSASRAYPNSLR